MHVCVTEGRINSSNQLMGKGGLMLTLVVLSYIIILTLNYRIRFTRGGVLVRGIVSLSRCGLTWMSETYIFQTLIGKKIP